MTSPDWARPVVYFSVQAVDPERQRAFYSTLFNWNIADGQFMQITPGVGSPEQGIGGHINRGETPGFSIYVQVRDIAASLALAVDLGGSKVHDPLQIPGGAMIAGIQDPEGNSVVLVQQ